MFVVEVTTGFISHSVALISDGLDMLSALPPVRSRSLRSRQSVQANAATTSGALLFLLGLGVLIDVARRWVSGEPPEGSWMIAVAFVALVVNAIVLKLLSGQRHGEVHFRATWIFTRVDVVADIAVILSGVAVSVTGWRYTDLVLGAAIGLYILKEATEILRGARHARKAA